MTHSLVPRVGGIVSADIAVPEHEREARFYSRVLTTGDRPLWREDLMNNLGMPVIGLGARTAEYERLPLQWMPHIQVSDVAASVKRALDLGASELMHAQDDDGNSQWAVLTDPNAAAFGLIPVVPAEAMPEIDETAGPVGLISGFDLTIPEASSTREFYEQVIGWSTQEVEMEDGGERYPDYRMLGGDGNPAAGIRHARGANQGVPPTWLMHLPVGDLAESVRRVREEGGKVLVENRGNDNELTRAVVEDLVGVCVALVPA